MSIDISSYLGPFLECDIHRIPQKYLERRCANRACSESNRRVYDENTNFCAKCGAKIEKIELERTVDSVDLWGFLDQIEQKLYFPSGDEARDWMVKNNKHIWLSNQRIPDCRRFSSEHEHVFRYCSVTQEQMDAEKKIFAEFYAAEIKKIHETYGIDKVELKWGLVHYCH